MIAAKTDAAAPAPRSRTALTISRVAIAIQLTLLGLLVIGRACGGIDDARLAHDSDAIAPTPIHVVVR